MAEKTKDLKQGIQEFTIKQALNYLEKDPEKNAPKILDMIDKVFPDDWFKEARDAIRSMLDEKGNWYQLLLKVYDLDAGVRKTFFEFDFHKLLFLLLYLLFVLMYFHL